ncbi:SLC13 family permease [Paracandidimonas soli]|uniref:Sodium-dependent dicarboxylate transporter 2/3/5 n=1 Tax=Paracandidimonas soli TaxID=1917182 RepID=A0A4R3UT63_9BURK|nr:DASS family sodium-coupled anion symporter [Paracandidimonas soli]TCU95186.1 sodium-dependent dicarboxylate transporter 2/3/5 [Paracandidimonas soli]
MTESSETLREPDGRFPKGIVKGVAIMAIAALLSVWLYVALPYEDSANKGLALLLFIAILWLTEAIHITVTALLIPVVALAIGIPDLTTQKAFETFADPIIFLFFGGFALATALHVQKLDRKIAMRLISLSGSNLAIATLAIFGVTAFLSMWISNTATAAMMLPLALGMLTQMDKEKDRNTFVFILLGIAYSASIGGLGTLVGSPPNAIAARALDMDFAGWMKIGLPMVLVLLPLMLLAMFIVLRPNLNRKIEVEIEDIPWTPLRITAMLIFAGTALAWIFSVKIASLLDITAPDSWIAVAAAIAVVVSGAANWRQVSDNTEWGVLFLFGGGLTLSSLLQSSGASLVLGQQVAQTFGGAHPFIVILVVAIFINVLTEFTSNTASAALLVPVFAAIATEMGMPVQVMVLVIGIGASCAFMLPVATPPNAIVFGTGFIKQREMISVGAVLNVFCIALITLWAYFFLM